MMRKEADGARICDDEAAVVVAELKQPLAATTIT